MTREVSYSLWAYRNGAPFRRLEVVSAPQITCKQGSAIKSSLGAKVIHDPDVDWLSDSIRPFLHIDGVEYPLGVFRAGGCTTSKTAQGFVDDIDAYDGCFLLSENKTTNVLHLPAGELYTNVIGDLMQQSGIPLAMIASSGEVLQTDREDWDVGTPLLTIANALLDEINYDEVWFDANGIAQAQPTKEASGSNIKHRYSPKEAKVSREYSSTLDIYDTPNVFTVICSNPDFEEPMYATVENNSMNSPISIPRRGMRVVKVYQVNNIASQEALEEYAQILKYESMMASQTVTITTELEPGHGVGDTVALNLDEHQGIYVEEGWSMTLGAGQKMKHTLRRVIYG